VVVKHANADADAKERQENIAKRKEHADANLKKGTVVQDAAKQFKICLKEIDIF
jgi:hypothetical protein